MLNTHTNIPIIKDPLSPMNILAGEKLKIKKPSRAPDNEKESDAKVYSLAKINHVPNTVEEISPTPAAKPSTPSIRFIAFNTTIYVNKDKKTLPQSGIPSMPNTPCNPVIRISPIRTKIKPTKILANNFFTGEVPMISSFTPTKKSTKLVATNILNSLMDSY